MEERDITARVRVTIKDNIFNVQTKNVFSLFEELHILTMTQVIMGTDKELFDSYETVYFDGENPTICIAYNTETRDIRLSLSDIPENQEIGFLEQAKHVVMKDLMGE